MKLALLTVACLCIPLASVPAMAACPADVPEKLAKVAEIFVHYPQSASDANGQLSNSEHDLQEISNTLKNCSCLGAWKALDDALTSFRLAKESKIDYQYNIFNAYDM